VCWSHIRRDFRRHADGLAEQRPSASKALSSPASVCCVALLPARASRRDQLKAQIALIQTELHELLEQASPRRHAIAGTDGSPTTCSRSGRTLDICHRRRDRADQNPAERALRAPVIHRKISLGTQSEGGERFAERALSAASTCRHNTAHYSPTSANYSSLTTAATRSPRSPEAFRPRPRD